MSFSFGSSKKKTSQQQEQNPWKPVIPSLNTILGRADDAADGLVTTPNQSDAFSTLIARAQGGNPYAPGIDAIARDTLAGPGSRSGVVDDAYTRLTSQIGDTAAGNYVDFASNPYVQDMLRTVGDDVQNRISQQFAGMGRDITGNAAGLRAVAKGVTEAQTPILADLYSRERNNQMAAAQALFGAGNTAATTGQQLDTADLAARAGGVDLSTAALAARDQPENAVLNLEQQQKALPFEDLSLWANLILPMAGLGGNMTGTGTQKGSTSGFGLPGISDVGKLITAFGTLSDERAKEDVSEVGKTKDGQTIYRYRYKDDPSGQYHIGLMAQEVEKKHPEAVSERPDGLKSVDYFSALEGSARMGRRHHG